MFVRSGAPAQCKVAITRCLWFCWFLLEVWWGGEHNTVDNFLIILEDPWCSYFTAFFVFLPGERRCHQNSAKAKQLRSYVLAEASPLSRLEGLPPGLQSGSGPGCSLPIVVSLSAYPLFGASPFWPIDSYSYAETWLQRIFDFLGRIVYTFKNFSKLIKKSGIPEASKSVRIIPQMTLHMSLQYSKLMHTLK